jgi:hypothetical protein
MPNTFGVLLTHARARAERFEGAKNSCPRLRGM